MASDAVVVKNLPDVIRAIYDIRKALERGGELGKVYSTGADQGRGRYEHWVQSAERQVWFHRRTGWPTDQDAVDYFEKEAQTILDKVFRNIEPGNVRDALRGFILDLLQGILEFMQDYPPVPVGSTYVRTYTLHDSWTTESYI